MADSSGDKKHLASDKRRRQAREQGQVVKSQDLTSAGLLLAAIAALWFLGEPAAESMAAAIESSLADTKLAPMRTSDAVNWMLRIAGRLAIASVPMLITMFIAGVLANVVQTGLLIAPEKVAPQTEQHQPDVRRQADRLGPRSRTVGFRHLQSRRHRRRGLLRAV